MFGSHVGEDFLHASSELFGALVFACDSNNRSSWESGKVFLEAMGSFTVGVVSFATNLFPGTGPSEDVKTSSIS